jgi:hypothetical protein
MSTNKNKQEKVIHKKFHKTNALQKKKQLCVHTRVSNLIKFQKKNITSM